MAGILLPFQRRWIDDKSRFKIGMWSRQIGKTFTTTLEIVDDCFEHDVRGGKTRWVILSRGERQAKEAMDEGVKLHMRAYGLAFDLIENEYECDASWVDGKKAAYKQLEVVFPNGSRITALPANPDTARGYSANVFLDEFAFHAKSRLIWAALFPVISKPGLKLRITSTPNGKGNRFFELWTANSTRWSKHKVDIYQAIADGLDRDIEELREGAGDDDLWRQEYELEFLDEASAWLTYELIMACEDADAGIPARYQGGPCFIGNDIARRNDLWVAWLYELLGDVLWTREIVTLKNAPFAAHDAEIARLMSHYNVTRLIMDQTGMGEKPVEDMQKAHGRGRVTGMLMTSGNRMSIAQVGRQAFEDRRLRIPAGDPKLRADLHKIKMVNSETGMPRLIADRDAEGHADRAWSCFMGAAGADPFIIKPDDGLLLWYRKQAEEARALREAAGQR